jgi:hypothetical protein
MEEKDVEFKPAGFNLCNDKNRIDIPTYLRLIFALQGFMLSLSAI